MWGVSRAHTEQHTEKGLSLPGRGSVGLPGGGVPRAKCRAGCEPGKGRGSCSRQKEEEGKGGRGRGAGALEQRLLTNPLGENQYLVGSPGPGLEYLVQKLHAQSKPLRPHRRQPGVGTTPRRGILQGSSKANVSFPSSPGVPPLPRSLGWFCPRQLLTGGRPLP